MLYTMLTKKFPFYGDCYQAIRGMVLAGKYKIPLTVPESARELLRGMLQVTESERFGLSQVQNHPQQEPIQRS